MVIAPMLLTLFAQATAANNLPQGLLSALCFVESSHRVDVSNPDDGDGPSIGVCEIKYTTAEQMGFHYAENLYSPEVNIKYAAKYLRYQLSRYNGDSRCAAAAYNAGSCRRNQKGQIMNRQYVSKVFKAWAQGR